MKKLFLLALGVSLLAGCGGKDDANDPNVLVHNDSEELAGWIPDSPDPSLNKEKAHSGQYSIKIDANHEYSMGYASALGKLSGTRIKKFTVSAWVLVPKAGTAATFVTVVTRPSAPTEKPQFYQSVSADKGKTPGKWEQISQEVTLPETVVPTDVLGIYLWRNSGTQPIYLDDLRVTLKS